MKRRHTMGSSNSHYPTVYPGHVEGGAAKEAPAMADGQLQDFNREYAAGSPREGTAIRDGTPPRRAAPGPAALWIKPPAACPLSV
jgi:hypothetical protein